MTISGFPVPYRTKLHTLLVLFVAGILAVASHAQNLVPNPQFEDYTNCPNDYGLIAEYAPWLPLLGTSDAFNACNAPLNDQDVPINFVGYQYAHSGDGYAGLYANLQSNFYREMIRVELPAPLEENACYRIGFFANLANEGCGIDHLGLLLTNTPDPDPLGLIPQIEFTGTYLSDTVNWVEIAGLYTANGGERYITIGNFYDDANTTFDPECYTQNVIAYYYIDDVSIELLFNETIEVDLGAIERCNAYTINPGYPNINFTWNTGATGSTLLVNESGMYTATGHLNCTLYTVAMEVTIPVNTPVDLGPDQLILCESDEQTFVLDPALGDYTWQDGSTNSMYVVNQPGEYSVTLNNGCFVSSDTVTISEQTIPGMDFLGLDALLCDDDILTYNFDPANGTIIWQDNSIEHSYIIAEGGNYAVTITNACGSFVDELMVTTEVTPFFQFPNDFAICQGEMVTIDPGIADATYLWNDGSVNSTLTTSTAGTYALTISNSCGSDADTIVLIDGGAAPIVSLGVDTALCNGSTILLSPNFTNVDSWFWQDGSTMSTYTVSSAGTYIVNGLNACGDDSDTIAVALLPDVPPLNLGPDVSLCPGETIPLLIVEPNVSITWSDGSTDPEYSITTAGMISASIANTCGISFDTILATLLPAIPALNLGPDQTICPGETLTIDPQIAGVSYLWQDGSSNATYTTTMGGVIHLTISNVCGNSTDSVVVMENDQGPQVDLGADVMACEGDTIVLPAGVTGVTYVWQDGSTDNVLTVNSTGSYSITVSNGCGADSDTVLVTLEGPPAEFTFGIDTILCPGQTLLLFAPATTDDLLMWQDGSSSHTFLAEHDGTYALTISNDCGNTSDTLIISFNSQIPVVDLPAKLEWCAGDEFTLDAAQNFPALYLWSTGESSPTITVATPGIYSVEVSTPCTTISDETTVDQRTVCDSTMTAIFVPNVFSPNGDQVNDVFTVSFHPDMTILGVAGAIYDRWGNLLFESTQLPFTWDGTRNGQYVNPGVYVFKFNIEYQVGIRNVIEQITGDVTILR